MPTNGWWHEWTFNYDVKVEYNQVHLDLGEHEAKILVWLGEDWQPPSSKFESDSLVESVLNSDMNVTEENCEQQRL